MPFEQPEGIQTHTHRERDNGIVSHTVQAYFLAYLAHRFHMIFHVLHSIDVVSVVKFGSLAIMGAIKHKKTKLMKQIFIFGLDSYDLKTSESCFKFAVSL